MIHTNLNNLFTNIANAIRMKNNSTDKIIADNFPTVIENTLGINSDDATAKSTEILSNATAYVKNTKIIGTMNNQGTKTATLSTQNSSYTIPQGYHNGSGKVTANITNLTAANIKSGTVVGGITGTYAGSGAKTASGSERVSSTTSPDYTWSFDTGLTTCVGVVLYINTYVDATDSYTIGWIYDKSTGVNAALYTDGDGYFDMDTNGSSYIDGMIYGGEVQFGSASNRCPLVPNGRYLWVAWGN